MDEMILGTWFPGSFYYMGESLWNGMLYGVAFNLKINEK
jgi:hypothetical protein